MATNDNEWCEEPRYSKDVCSAMRRINALETADSVSEQFDRKWGSAGTSAGGMDEMGDISVYDDEVYGFFTDTWTASSSGYLSRIQVWNLEGEFQREWDVSNSSTLDIWVPAIIKARYNSVTSQGEIFVMDVYGLANDSTGYAIHVYNTTGDLVDWWGRGGTGTGQISNDLINQVYMDVYNNEVYISDFLGSTVQLFRIQVFGLNGVYKRGWSSYSTEDGDLAFPRGINGYDGEIYMAQFSPRRVQVLSPTGGYLRQWGQDGSGDGEFRQILSITEHDDRIVVSDRSTDLAWYRAQVFTTTGEFLRTFGASGTGDGEFTSSPFIGDSYAAEFFGIDPISGRIQVMKQHQTEFYSYTTDTKASLGLPDKGVSNPTDNELVPIATALLIPNHITDMRDAVETLSTSYGYNWTPGSTDNLYHNAVDRTDFGMAASGGDDWQRGATAMVGTPTYDIDIGEVGRCLDTLEAT